MYAEDSGNTREAEFYLKKNIKYEQMIHSDFLPMLKAIAYSTLSAIYVEKKTVGISRNVYSKIILLFKNHN
jgi:hypothetical protein